MRFLAKYLAVAVIVGAILAVTLTALPAASAQPAVTAKVSKTCFAGYWYDNYGNDYQITGKSTSTCSNGYSFSGTLYSSPYLCGTPWKVAGYGSYSGGFEITVEISSGGISCGDSAFVQYGYVSGTPPSETASGTWQDLSVSGTGSFTLTQTAAGPATHGAPAGAAPGKPTSAQPASVTAKTSKNCFAGYWYDNQQTGNDYQFTGKSTSPCSNSYTFKGTLYSSPYLCGVPWPVVGYGSYSGGFDQVMEITSGGISCDQTAWLVYGYVSGTPPSEVASGTWVDLSFAGTGSFTEYQTAAGPVATNEGASTVAAGAP